MVEQLVEKGVAAGRIISLYSGAGGLDFGMEAAGFETAVALDLDRDACETVRSSRPRWKVLQRPIADVRTEELLEVAGMRRGEPDLLIGGPPCQPFSKSGYWSRGDALRLRDPRADTLAEYLRVLEESLPRTFLLENVQGLAYLSKSEGLRFLLDGLRAINKATSSNYVPHVRIVNAAWYGVPQLRERVIVVASREGKPFRFPDATHADADEGPSLVRNAPLEPYRTAWDALGDLPEPQCDDLQVRGKWAALLPSIPEGQNYLFHTERGGGVALFGWRRRYWSFLLKLAKSRPSWTIQAQPGPAIGPFHWSSRLLSTRELCRLQTFPDDVTISGSRVSVQRQVGNAVPSLLAEVLGRSIRTQLLGMRVPRGKPRLLPPTRSPVPPPEPLAPVPNAFRHLIGHHAAHPGTGLGRAAVRRRARGDTTMLTA